MSIIVDISSGMPKQPGTVGIDCRVLPGVDVVCGFERGLSSMTEVSPVRIRLTPLGICAI